MRWGILSFILFFPATSDAAILISEVAWMGSALSANHEWIELHNTGASPVDVTGWEISDGMKLRIPLKGTIAANSYAVLERTSDDSATGAAFLIYTGILVNTGVTVVLKRSDGGIEDQAAGGTDWKSIGGDNVTKETAQYTSSGWVTGAGTPGSANFGSVKIEPEDDEDDEDEEETRATTTTTHSSSGSSRRSPPGETVRLIRTDAALQLTIDAQKVGYVNQKIDLEVKPSAVGKTIGDSLVYAWNFGDGLASSGKEVTHAFLYPGTYIVTVFGSYAKEEQLARHEITILPVTLSLTRSQRGDVQINNESPYELDISEYRIKGQKTFTFPAYSILLPNQTITIPRVKIGGGTLVVYDALGSPVASSDVSATSKTALETKNKTAGSVLPVAYSSTASTLANGSVVSPFSFANTAPLEEAPTTSEIVLEVDAVQNEAAVAASPSGVPTNAWPYLALIALITVGMLGVVYKPQRNQGD